MGDLVRGPRVWNTQDVEKYAIWKTWSLVENMENRIPFSFAKMCIFLTIILGMHFSIKYAN